MILKNWLIDLLSRYHRISVKEMASQEGGSIHLKYHALDWAMIGKGYSDEFVQMLGSSINF